jgi:hypothetical protein
MEVAADVLARNECRQSAVARGVDFVAFIAQFGRYKGKTERRVNVVFRARQKKAVIDRSHAGVIEQTSALQGDVAKPVEMLLASRQLEQESPRRLRCSAVDGNVCALQREIYSVGLPMENASRLGRSLESIEHRRWGVGGDDKHEVIDQVLPAAQ